MRRLNILTWHTHGSYLYYLTQAPHEFFVVSKPGRPPGYSGVCGHLPWGPNVHDLPADEIPRQRLDCILFQDDAQYSRDQHELLSEQQRRLPKIYLEHDPPRANPTDELHPADDRDVLVVHVTAFNALMWRHEHSPTRVIEHGVVARDELELALGQPLLEADVHSPRAPGTLDSHYAPRATLRLMDSDELKTALSVLPANVQGVAVYSRTAPRRHPLVRVMPDDPRAAAQELFAVLREFDARGVKLIWVEQPPDTAPWEGVNDRLQRAASR